MPTPYGPYPATVVRIHDGDTALVTLDLGFGINYTISCRFYGINAPELSTDAGKLARDHLASIMPNGSAVTILSYGWDKYGGRFDGVITYQGAVVNAQMVSDGFAIKIP
jgi:endonuclease YncB( thermonuclease family)